MGLNPLVYLNCSSRKFASHSRLVNVSDARKRRHARLRFPFVMIRSSLSISSTLRGMHTFLLVNLSIFTARLTTAFTASDSPPVFHISPAFRRNWRHRVAPYHERKFPAAPLRLAARKRGFTQCGHRVVGT